MAQVRVVQVPIQGVQFGTIGATLNGQAVSPGAAVQLGKFNNTTGTFYRDPTNPSGGGAGQQIQVSTHLANRTLGYIVGTGTASTNTISTQTLAGAGYFSIWNAGNVQQSGITIQIPNATGQQAKAIGSQQPLNQQAANYYAGFSQPLNQQAANYYGGFSQPSNYQPPNYYPGFYQAPNYYGGFQQPANYQPPNYYGGGYSPGNYNPAFYFPRSDFFGYQRPASYTPPNYNPGSYQYPNYYGGLQQPGNYQPPNYYPGAYSAPNYYGGVQQPGNYQPPNYYPGAYSAPNYYGGFQQPLNQQAANYYAGNSQPNNQQAAVYYAGVSQPLIPATNQPLTGTLYNGSLVNPGQIASQGFAITIPNIGTLTTQGGTLSGTGSGGSFQFPGTYTRTASAAVSTQQGIVNFQGTTKN